LCRLWPVWECWPRSHTETICTAANYQYRIDNFSRNPTQSRYPLLFLRNVGRNPEKFPSLAVYLSEPDRIPCGPIWPLGGGFKSVPARCSNHRNYEFSALRVSMFFSVRVQGDGGISFPIVKRFSNVFWPFSKVGMVLTVSDPAEAFFHIRRQTTTVAFFFVKPDKSRLIFESPPANVLPRLNPVVNTDVTSYYQWGRLCRIFSATTKNTTSSFIDHQLPLVRPPAFKNHRPL